MINRSLESYPRSWKTKISMTPSKNSKRMKRRNKSKRRIKNKTRIKTKNKRNLNRQLEMTLLEALSNKYPHKT